MTIGNDAPLITAQIASAYYSKARDEAVERIKLRDSALTLFLTAVSVIAAFFIGLVTALHETSFEVAMRYGSYALIIVPIVASAAASVISQHHVLLGAIEAYLVTELDPALREFGITLPQWDRSGPVMRLKRFSILSRSRGHQLMIVWLAGAMTLVFLVIQTVYGPLASVPIALEAAPSQVAEGSTSGFASAATVFLEFVPASVMNQLLTQMELPAVLFAVAAGTYSTLSAWLSIFQATRERMRFLRDMEKTIKNR